MSNNKVLINDTNLTNIANAIRTKNGSSNLYTVGDMATAIENISSGSITIEEKDVNFRDYDGTLVASYTANEFASLSTLPDNPSHSGLTAQGWNWTLTDAKTYVAAYGKLEIGQMYITDDGNTRIYIHLEEEDLELLCVCLNVVGTIQIDWGDGSTYSSMSGTVNNSFTHSNHQYNSAGNYTIKIIPNENTTSISIPGGTNNNVYSAYVRLPGSNLICKPNVNDLQDTFTCFTPFTHVIQKIELGQKITNIGSAAFYRCSTLQSVTIPNGVTAINYSAFSYCPTLESIIIPNGVTTIGNNAFRYCYSLKSVTIPNSITTMGNYIFSGCELLESITIPNGITTMGSYTFSDCYSLQSVTIPNGITTMGSYTFSYCCSLKSVTIPNSVTTIDSNVFSSCYSLESIIIPNGVTTINKNAFSSCYSLKSVTIPNSVTTIDSNAFSYCYIANYDFTNHTTIPTLTNTNVFVKIETGRIIVPDNLYEEWKVATNWATYADKIIKASEA